MLGVAFAFPGSKAVTFVWGLMSAASLVLLFVCIPSLKVRRDASKEMGAIEFSKADAYDQEVLTEFEALYTYLCTNQSFLFEYGYALYHNGNFEKSIQILKRGIELSSDPMFHNVIGLCYQNLGYYDTAIMEFQYSHFMIPSRILPLYLELLLYDEIGEKEAVTYLAKIIYNMPLFLRIAVF